MTLDSYPLKQRTDLHIARKLWHVCGVSTMVVVHHLINTDQALKVLSIVAFLMVSVDIFRHRIPALNQFMVRWFGIFMREHERAGTAGTTYLMIGTFIIVLVFPKPIVSLSLLFLALADPLASYFGIRYGKDKLTASKSLQGTVAAFVVCTLISTFYFAKFELMTERLLIVSLVAGLIGAISELIPVGKLDDNLTFPVVSAALLWLMFKIFGGL